MIRFRLGTSVLQFRRSVILYGVLKIAVILAIAYILLRSLYHKIPKNESNINGIRDEKDELTELQHRLSKLEDEIQKNKVMLGQVKNTVRDWIKYQPDSKVMKNFAAPIPLKSNRTFVHLSPSDCQLCLTSPAQVQQNVFDIYENLEFDNQDGGVWKQGWNIEYKEEQWNPDKKLKIFVVPHSHNDPGWIKTFEKYFKDQTQHILNNMVLKMKDDKRRKFIWAEISFLAFWWDHIDENKKLLVKRFVDDGQLEIVTGGWVMNDEATTHYYAIIEQMVEGHQWLEHNLDFRPKNGWAIDPFGLSPTMAYLLRRMGLDNMVIQRVHYSIKKYLSERKSLEFLWRQPWDHNHTMDILCHIMPFYSYDIPHTCGPDPKICCQFDFKRLPGNKVNCPWRVPPTAIHERNVAEKSRILLDQYRKKSQLFQTNVVMVQLGDDFRYDKITEWDQQFDNYQKLFDFINKKKEWNAEVQFGTLDDYFTALRAESGTDSRNMPLRFPSLSGDFFTYADRDDHYWSGYYTSRPYYKNMDRVLEAYLRGAEILFSLMWADLGKSAATGIFFMETLLNDLVYSRRALSLFQHHDAITGTSKDHVVLDYASKMFNAMNKLQNIIGQTAFYLLLPESQKTLFSPQAILQSDEYRTHHSTMPVRIPVKFTPASTIKQVVLYNSLSHSRKEVVIFHVSSPAVQVRNQFRNLIPSQINPVFKKKDLMKDEFEVAFIAEVPPLGLAVYNIELLVDSTAASSRAMLSFYNTDVLPDTQDFVVQQLKSPLEFSIKSNLLTATFSGTDGLIKQLSFNEGNFAIDVRILFLKYGTRKKGKDKSGAYIFLPEDQAQEITVDNPSIRVIEGSLMSEVSVFFPEIEHRIRLKSSPGADGTGFEIYNVVDLSKETNKELVMRILTNVSSESHELYTDLNGLQMIKRHILNKLPLQANVYPITTMAYFENFKSRFSLLTGHSLGVTSIQPGSLDVFIDRRLNQDDNRGLQQGITDNKETPVHFRIIVEQYAKTFTEMPSSNYASLLAQHASLSLLHPLFTLVHVDQGDSISKLIPHSLQPEYSPVGTELPCDVHLLNLRTLVAYSSGTVNIPSNSTSLFLHRLGFDCRFLLWGVDCSTKNGTVSIDNLFPKLFGSTVEEASLSLMYMGNKFPRDAFIQLPSMEIVTLKLSIR